LLEHNGTLSDERMDRLQLASALCQVVTYLSLGALIALWYSMSKMVGIAFTVSAITAMVLVRLSMHQTNSSVDESSH